MTDETFPFHQEPLNSEVQQHKEHPWKESKLDFESEFLALLTPDSSNGKLIFAFIRVRLKQFRLDKAYTEAFVLNEVYLRAISSIQKGSIIRIPQAWIKSTAYNYIRELSRQHQKLIFLEAHCLDDLDHELGQNLTKDEDDVFNTSLALIIKALGELAPEEQKLLKLKVVDGLAWKKIQALPDYRGCTLPSLRKRKQRILKKLHRIYHCLENLPHSTPGEP